MSMEDPERSPLRAIQFAPEHMRRLNVEAPGIISASLRQLVEEQQKSFELATHGSQYSREILENFPVFDEGMACVAFTCRVPVDTKDEDFAVPEFTVSDDDVSYQVGILLFNSSAGNDLPVELDIEELVIGDGNVSYGRGFAFIAVADVFRDADGALLGYNRQTHLTNGTEWVPDVMTDADFAVVAEIEDDLFRELEATA